MSQHRCSVCDALACQAITGMVGDGCHIEFNPPEYRCAAHLDDNAVLAEIEANLASEEEPVIFASKVG